MERKGKHHVRKRNLPISLCYVSLDVYKVQKVQSATRLCSLYLLVFPQYRVIICIKMLVLSVGALAWPHCKMLVMHTVLFLFSLCVVCKTYKITACSQAGYYYYYKTLYFILHPGRWSPHGTRIFYSVKIIYRFCKQSNISTKSCCVLCAFVDGGKRE